MPEEHHTLAARRGSQVNLRHGLNTNSGQYEQQITTEILSRPRDPETGNPEMLARALFRARESIRNNENIDPEKSRSRRQRRRRVSISRSPLPADYPRAPLQDITLYMHILERTRVMARARMQMHGTNPRQPMIHVSSQEILSEVPQQEMERNMANSTSVLEEPIQGTETETTNQGQETETTMANSTVVLEGPLQQSEITLTNPLQIPEHSTLPKSEQLLEHETHELTTDPKTGEQNYAPERAVSHHGNMITDSSLTTGVGLEFHHDYQMEDARASHVSMLANQELAIAFETLLQSETWNEPSGCNLPQAKKKSSMKPLMKMR